MLADLVGKGKESRALDQAFHAGISVGPAGIVKRINMLKGMSIQDIDMAIERNPSLMPGARELTDFLHSQGIISILASGSIMPVLEYYQQHLLYLDYIIGSRPKFRNGVLEGITEADYSDSDYKLVESKQILNRLGINASETVAIGDSPGDRSRFEFAGHAIAINPKRGIEKHADFVIHDDLAQAIPIIRAL